MAILTEKVVYYDGQSVSAKIINDTIETAVYANEKASDAEKKSSEAKNFSQQAFENAQTAKSVSEQASARSISAQISAENATSRVTSLEQRANSGEFNGRDGVLTMADGMYGFEVRDGDLYLYYTGQETPPLSINDNGELIINF